VPTRSAAHLKKTLIDLKRPGGLAVTFCSRFGTTLRKPRLRDRLARLSSIYKTATYRMPDGHQLWQHSSTASPDPVSKNQRYLRVKTGALTYEPRPIPSISSSAAAKAASATTGRCAGGVASLGRPLHHRGSVLSTIIFF